MEHAFTTLDDRRAGALVDADYSTVQCLLQDDTTWGVETLRLAGLPSWLTQTFSWAGWLYPAKMVPRSRQMFWAQLGVKRPVLAYRIERAADNRVRIIPSAPIGARGRWMLMLGMGVLMPVLLMASNRQVRQRSASMLPAFCQYLQSRLR